MGLRAKAHRSALQNVILFKLAAFANDDFESWGCCAVNLRFWQKPNSWPRDPRGYKFLARAFDQVGKVVFGETWKGVDKWKIVDRLPQSVRKATTQQRRRAHLILKQHFPNRPKPKTVPFADKNTPVYTFTEQEWATAYQFAQEAFQHEQTTAEVIAEACSTASRVGPST